MISSAGNRTSVRACSIKTDCRIMAESLTMTERLTVIEVGTLKKRREESTFSVAKKLVLELQQMSGKRKPVPMAHRRLSLTSTGLILVQMGAFFSRLSSVVSIDQNLCFVEICFLRALNENIATFHASV